jgi:hypothetical protein
VLAFWLAFMVNASVDVFLEGPQGGIWFWCLMGFGIAALEAQRRALATARQYVPLRFKQQFDLRPAAL